jgi:flagellar motor switch protein FliG
MPPANYRFTRLQKIAIFLIVMGPHKAREILGDLSLDTIESINEAIQNLKQITPQEKAATMIEFGDFFYKGKPLSAKLKEPTAKKKAKPKATAETQAKKKLGKPETKKAAKEMPPVVHLAELDEKTIAETLAKLKDKVDPGKIDWGKAGYDFGEGFSGSSNRPR